MPALDVYSSNILMKKNRSATKLTVLVEPGSAHQFESIIFSETNSLGIRRWTVDRTKLKREAIKIDSEFGPIAGKLISMLDGSKRFTPEYDDCRKIAIENGIPIVEVYRQAQSAFEQVSNSGTSVVNN